MKATNKDLNNCPPVVLLMILSSFAVAVGLLNFIVYYLASKDDLLPGSIDSILMPCMGFAVGSALISIFFSKGAEAKRKGTPLSKALQNVPFASMVIGAAALAEAVAIIGFLLGFIARNVSYSLPFGLVAWFLIWRLWNIVRAAKKIS